MLIFLSSPLQPLNRKGQRFLIRSIGMQISVFVCVCCFLHINISDICACLVFLRWQPLQSLPWTLRHDQKHICANLILRVAFIRHADCCSGIFLFLILSLPPSFLLFSLHHRSQGFPLLFTCFFSPPHPPSASPFPLLAPLTLSLAPFLLLTPWFRFRMCQSGW